MTQDEIIKMAREAGFVVGEPWREMLIERFAQLVAQAEREACADECVEQALKGGFAADCAEAIRARGQS